MNDTKKFVVLASRRTGSNYLQSLLNSHPDIFCFGELLVQAENVLGELRREGIGEKRLEIIEDLLRDRDDLGAIEALYSMASSLGASTSGFRYFREHRGFLRDRRVVGYLKAHGIQVIHLRRRNLLRKFLSLKMAEKHKVWTSKENVSLEKIELDPEECTQFIRTSERIDRSFQRRLRKLPVFELAYEDLSDDTARQLESIQVFLGVEPSPCSSNLKKINNLPLRDSIENYEELWEKMRGTQWMRFFDD